MSRGYAVLIILGLTGCFRPEISTVRISVPEAESEAELNLIRQELWDVQDSLPDQINFYESITLSMQPEPALEIGYFNRHLGKQNVLYQVHRLGYSVEGRSGDPSVRLKFLAESQLP
jgi:hypothetical protein